MSGTNRRSTNRPVNRPMNRRTFLYRAGGTAVGAGLAGALGSPALASGTGRAGGQGQGQGQGQGRGRTAEEVATGDITFALASLALAPGVDPSSSTNTDPDEAFTLLTDGETSPVVGYDFSGAEPSGRYVDVTATFGTPTSGAPAEVRSVRLLATGVDTATVTFTAWDFTTEERSAEIRSLESGLLAVEAEPEKTEPIRSVTVRVATTGDTLELAELNLTGTAHGLVQLSVDSAERYAHSPGSSFTVDVLPSLVAFGNLAHLASQISVTPSTTPEATEGVAEARDLLTDGRLLYGDNRTVFFEFPDDGAKRWVNVRADFPDPVDVQSVTLTGANLGTAFSMFDIWVTFLNASGNAISTHKALRSTFEINQWRTEVTARLGLDEPVTASAVVVRAHTSFRINLTELQITGLAGESLPDVPAPELTAAWYDHRGDELSSPVALAVGEAHSIASPSDPAIGYYGLVFSTSDQVVFLDHVVGEDREYGFAVLPPRAVADRSLDPGSSFGTVHTDLNDPYVVGWSKTITWLTGNFNPQGWQNRIDRHVERGLVELPLVPRNGEWKSQDDPADTNPIPQSQLDALYERLRAHFEADPSVTHWELGLEENLMSGGEIYDAPYYWPNLDAKVRVARQAAVDAGVDAKFCYQLAEPDQRREDVIRFLNSDAAATFDIFAIHPYAWPDFKTPETWMADMMSFVLDEMRKAGRTMEIWFTEVGAPHNRSYPGGIFGKKGGVRGLTREEGLNYLIKLHVLGLQHGADKIFWYNYKDRGFDDRTFPEQAFGTVDFWRFPKPAYLGYVTLVHLLDHREPAGVDEDDGLWHATFAGENDDVHVVWQFNGGGNVSWSRLGLEKGDVVELTSAVGAELPVQQGGFHVDYEPVFITARRSS
ncbi:hypothetical protein [Phytoactinopolyspora endophytica]|uniref:hypothetical protein n=1 Tax=Phytoactinopolyspora endophytica TaxID=1642495 RepID=UPI00101D16DF|nr:hypothetical protein [Phytoactinopolyspora endophytica]